MVSFQCNACGDVCTKPKLDKHRGQCQSSFDCIDCGKRFNTPADYKGHTTCITEAEKYEKSVYKGPRQNGNRGGNNNQQSWSLHGGQQGGNRPGWGRTISRATGANDTPLGTPVRMSPITDTPPPPPPPKPTAVVTCDQATPIPAESQVPNPNTKKRKSPDESVQVSTEIDVGRSKKKKSKKIPDDADLSEKSDKKSKEDKLKEKKAIKPSTILTAEISSATETEGKKKKEKKSSEVKDDEKKKKKTKDVDVVIVDPQPLGESVISANSKPKKRPRDDLEGTVPHGRETEDKKKSSKKKKKETAAVDLKEPHPMEPDASSDAFVKKKSLHKTAEDETNPSKKEKKDKKSKKSKSDTAVVEG